jgi:hypothetical protein
MMMMMIFIWFCSFHPKMDTLINCSGTPQSKASGIINFNVLLQTRWFYEELLNDVSRISLSSVCPTSMDFIAERLNDYKEFLWRQECDTFFVKQPEWSRVYIARILVSIYTSIYALSIQKRTVDNSKDNVYDSITDSCQYIEYLLFGFVKTNFELVMNCHQENPQTHLVLRSLKAFKADHSKKNKSKKTANLTMNERLVFVCDDDKLKEAFAILDLYRKERFSVNE